MPKTFNVPVTVVVSSADAEAARKLVNQFIGDASANYTEVETWQVDEAYAADEDEED